VGAMVYRFKPIESPL
jgi:hypothetical protein